MVYNYADARRSGVSTVREVRLVMKGMLVLEDGMTFVGESFGAVGERTGEVVFNTGMTGYQEILTDPSYCGQIVTMTYPLIGNYGTSPGFHESARPRVKALIVHENCEFPSHWAASDNLDGYLREHGVVGLAGIDTRRLTRHLREQGTMMGCVVTGADESLARELAGRAAGARSEGLVDEVTTPRPYRIYGDGPKVVVIDYGVKLNILRCLRKYDCEVTVVPAHYPARDVLDLEPDGVLLSNGPGDPRDVTGATGVIRDLMDRVPIFGICLGHQLLGMTCGGDVYKLKYGHRGANHPVRDHGDGRVYITNQNHGYALREETLPTSDLVVTHRNVNDGSVEGLRHSRLPAFSIQYHPEAGPGPTDSTHLFDRFLEMMK
jgi:carbamoyl-phosphate synthase small subunit